MSQVRDLTVCRACTRDFVVPLNWYEASETHWHVRMRCGNCGLVEWGLFDQVTVDAFDARLEDQIDEIVDSLHRLIRQNMAEDVERFSYALEHDAILPEDFGMARRTD